MIERLEPCLVHAEPSGQPTQRRRTRRHRQQQLEHDKIVVVGVNKFQEAEIEVPSILKIDPALEQKKVEALKEMRAGRDNAAVRNALEVLGAAVQVGPPLWARSSSS